MPPENKNAARFQSGRREFSSKASTQSERINAVYYGQILRDLQDNPAERDFLRFVIENRDYSGAIDKALNEDARRCEAAARKREKAFAAAVRKIIQRAMRRPDARFNSLHLEASQLFWDRDQFGSPWRTEPRHLKDAAEIAAAIDTFGISHDVAERIVEDVFCKWADSRAAAISAVVA